MSKEQARRAVQTIEVDRWSEPVDGRVKHLGMITAKEAFDALESHLESVGLVPDEYFTLSVGVKGSQELPNFHTADCHVNWGTNEGIYLDISLLTWNDAEGRSDSFHFVTGKTLDASGDAFLMMSRIAAECSMMLNGRGRVVSYGQPDELNGADPKQVNFCEQTAQPQAIEGERFVQC